MLNLAVLVLGSVVGFIASRRLRRPDRAAQAASMARNVGGSLGRRRGLDAPELQRACFSEMVRHVRVTRQGRTHAPARYTLHLHPDDLAVVDEARRWFTEGLADALRRAARDNGWVIDGAVEIDYLADPARRPGVPAAMAVPPEEPQGAAPTAPPPAPSVPPSARGLTRTLTVVRTDTGQRIPLATEVVTIGRSRDRTITIDDNRVSRGHARIEPRPGGWAIVDEGSANGTRVGGTDLPAGQPRPLRVGDVIGVGPVELRILAAPAAGGQPGTRALDDSERTRISGEFLRPPRRPDR